MNYQELRKEPSAIEQLQALSEDRKRDLENTLLKEALALSSENCEMLLKESKNVLQEAEKNRQNDYKSLSEGISEYLDQLSEDTKDSLEQMNVSIERLRTSNQKLEKEIDTQILALTGSVREATVEQVRASLYDMDYELRNATENLQKRLDGMEKDLDEVGKKVNKIAENYIDQLDNKVFRVKQAKRSLFRFEGVVNVLFWLGVASSIGTFILLYVIFEILQKLTI